MEIKISLDKIQNGIMQLTAILGRNRQDMEIAVTQDNLPAIGIYIGEAVTEAENELRRHLKDSNKLSLYKNDEAVSFTFADKLRAANSTKNQIASSLELYLIHYTIARWCATTESLSALAEAYQNSSAGYISKISSLICQRQAYTVSDTSYQARDSDTICMTDNAQKRKYSTRKRDLQLTGKVMNEWPYSAIVSTDPAIIKDANDMILIAKPKCD